MSPESPFLAGWRGVAVTYLGIFVPTACMSESNLSLGRIGFILMIIVQSIYIPLTFINLPDAADLAILTFSIVATIFASLIFRYFSDVYGSTLAKVTFIMTLIAILGLVFSAAVLVIGFFFIPLLIVALILLLCTLPAVLVYYILWGVTFIKVSEDTGNPSLMMAGGIIFLIGWGIGFVGIFAIISAIAQTIAVLGLILVAIVLFTSETGA